MKKIALGVTLALAAGVVQAQGFNSKNMYFGGGLSSNDADGFDSNATGYQFFGGYQLKNVKLGALKSAVEVGYMNAGEFETCITIPGIPGLIAPQTFCEQAEIAGLWATYVGSYDFSPKLKGIGRVGLDFGDDDGLMFGAGLDYAINPQFAIRGEYVIRQHTNSLQANLVYYPK